MSNRRKRRALLALGSATLAVAVGLPGSSHADPTPSIDEVRKQVDRLYHQAELMAERANELEDQMAVIKRRVKTLDADVERQETRLAELRGAIGQYAAAEYRSGGLDPTVRLLVADDPDEFLAQMTSAKAFAGQQGDLLRRLQAEQKRLAEQKAMREAELERYRRASEAAEKRMKVARSKAAKAKALLERLTEEERRRLREQEERERARDRSSRGGGDRLPPPPPGSGRGAIALNFARAQLGEPYVFGAAGPDAWDCSGLTMMAWRQAGVSLPHSSRQQYAVSRKISQSELRPGDLVFFYSDLHHVGIYAGDGMIIHAPRPGKVVEYIPMRYMPYAGAGRPG
ncbi:NlpC/P60 family protein [Thermasporomyces composti]|uniref:NlpC/P60 family protein n=1 Tax=Thermasporomyces composti TaxID=696763 RepID=A0A3D9UZG5_THECX|nr:C40 family peptidase [Thermasporomyces composti]REF34888.1 NlpC/P60 family protein [Thermasporomyces composti]